MPRLTRLHRTAYLLMIIACVVAFGGTLPPPLLVVNEDASLIVLNLPQKKADDFTTPIIFMNARQMKSTAGQRVVRDLGNNPTDAITIDQMISASARGESLPAFAPLGDQGDVVISFQHDQKIVIFQSVLMLLESLETYCQSPATWIVAPFPIRPQQKMSCVAHLLTPAQLKGQSAWIIQDEHGNLQLQPIAYRPFFTK